MVKYIAAIALATTVWFSSTPSEVADPEQQAAAAPAPVATIPFVRVDDGVRLSHGAAAKPVYHLNDVEQAALKRALFRKFKVLA